MERYRFATSPAGEPFAVPLDGPNLARMLRGGLRSLRAELAETFNAKRGRVPSSSALADALLVLEGRCSATTEELHLRVARHGAGVVVDQGDDLGRAVSITPGAWEVLDRSPVLFRRTELTSPLPQPASGGSLDELHAALHITGDSWPLVLAWLVAGLIPDISHPVLLGTGVQGSGKSTTQRRLAGLVDPSPAQLRAAPTDLDQWSVAASGSWVVPLDNLSTIPAWLSDALCRAATGDGLVKRRLYADDSVVVLSYRRVISMSAIDAGALRGDLADRLLVVDFQRFDGRQRRTDTDLDADWAALLPRALGALYELAGDVFALLPSVQLEDLPRMADYAKVLAAVDQVLGMHGLTAYRALGSRIAADVVDSDPVAVAVRELAQRDGYWRGSASELLDEITPDRAPRGWPANPARLSGRIKRASSVLLSLGIDVRNKSSQGRKLIEITVDGGVAGDAQLTLTSAPEGVASDLGKRHPSDTSDTHATPTGVGEGADQAPEAPEGVASVAPGAFLSLSNLEE